MVMAYILLIRSHISESLVDALTDVNILQAPFISPGVNAPCELLSFLIIQDIPFNISPN